MNRQHDTRTCTRGAKRSPSPSAAWSDATEFHSARRVPYHNRTFSHPCARHSRATGYDARKNVSHAPQGRVYVCHAVCDSVPHDRRRNVLTHPLRRRMPAHRASLLARLRVCIRGIGWTPTPRWTGGNTTCLHDLLKPVTDRPRRLSDGVGAHFLHVVTLCRNV